jgi:GWxTD domain-containing protein
MTSSRLKNAAFAFVLSSLVPLAASAALSPKYEEWRKGPVQWIMNGDEQKAWKNVKTDEEAIAFIDLFWVRRDPTPGTPQNEYKAEFNNRVKFSDDNYKERRNRGAMTDRGRAFILLGAPTSASVAAGSQEGSAAAADDGSRMRGSRDVWTWSHEDALKAFDLPKVELVFVQDPVSGRTSRDLHRPDFGPASAAALRKMIVNPGLTTVPDWAPKGGLEPKISITNIPFLPEPDASAPGTPATETPAPVKPAAKPGKAPAPAVVMAPVGASRLTLARDVYAIDTETKADPFTKMAPVAVFKAQDDLGWALQYCAGTEDEPTLRFTMRLTGTAAGEVIDRAAPQDEMVPDRIKASPGCYMLRGAVPLEGMNPGAYALEVQVENPAIPGTHTLKQEFTIE